MPSLTALDCKHTLTTFSQGTASGPTREGSNRERMLKSRVCQTLLDSFLLLWLTTPSASAGYEGGPRSRHQVPRQVPRTVGSHLSRQRSRQRLANRMSCDARYTILNYVLTSPKVVSHRAECQIIHPREEDTCCFLACRWICCRQRHLQPGALPNLFLSFATIPILPERSRWSNLQA